MTLRDYDSDNDEFVRVDRCSIMNKIRFLEPVESRHLPEELIRGDSLAFSPESMLVRKSRASLSKLINAFLDRRINCWGLFTSFSRNVPSSDKNRRETARPTC